MAKMANIMAKMAKNFRHYVKNGEKMFTIMAKIDGKMAKMARMAKMAKLRKIMAKMAKNFRHYGKNGKKMFTIFAIMAKIDGKMAKIAQINDENGDFFSPFSPFRHGENREKNNKWRMAMSPSFFF